MNARSWNAFVQRTQRTYRRMNVCNGASMQTPVYKRSHSFYRLSPVQCDRNEESDSFACNFVYLLMHVRAEPKPTKSPNAQAAQ